MAALHCVLSFHRDGRWFEGMLGKVHSVTEKV